jgi:hypothetical protein
MNLLRITCLLGFGFLAGCQSEVTPIIECEPSNGLTPVCGFQNPEDLAWVPDSDWIIVSQFGVMDGSRPGNLALFERNQETLQVVFPQETTGAAPPVAGWGEADCSMPGQEFAPHGLDLARLGDGRLRLLVVNHGGRESVEMFEVSNTSPRPEIHWRGCVMGPEDAYFNDLVNLSDGGFLATHMMPKSAQFFEQLKGLLGFDTGHVMRWSRGDGFSSVPGTDSPFPNGIEISADEKVIYLNIYMASEVRKIRLFDGELLATANVASPDNITWGSDNRLLVASHTDGLTELLACQELDKGACGFSFEIVELDSNTMARTTLLRHRGPPMGAATVALQLGSRIYMGSFAGDRIVYFDLTGEPR